MRQVPDPDHSEWVARLRERARLDAAELLPSPPFEVFGLAEPRPQPIALADTGRTDAEWQTITVAYGNWADPAGPFARVTSAVAGSDRRGLSADAELADAIIAERNRIAEHAGVDEEEPPGPPACRHEELQVGDARISALVCRHGTVWAARAQVGSVTMTVTGRGVDPGSVRLSPVTDLEPYLRGRSEMLTQLVEQHRRQPPPVLEPAEGVAAVRALTDAALERHARTLAAVITGRERRRQASEGAVMGALWQRAVAEQARLSGTDAVDADQVVTSVVNHLIHLKDQASWFTADPRLREAAIEETLRHAVLREDVPSKSAQQAWARYWAHRTSLGGYAPQAMLAELAVGEPGISAWLDAWAAWTQRI
jgi:hypothetical protein